MKKIWKDINLKGYSTVYKVSNFGEVLSVRSGKILKPSVWDGRHEVTLCKGGIEKRISIERAVAELFPDINV